MRRLLLVLALLWAPTAAAQAPEEPDLTLPAWDLCPGPGGVQMACFTAEEVKQLLRLQARAQYSLELEGLHLQLEVQTQGLVTALDASRAAYVSLQALDEERNAALLRDLSQAQSRAERYQRRLERRRIWPWVGLGAGVLLGGFLGYEVAR